MADITAKASPKNPTPRLIVKTMGKVSDITMRKKTKLIMFFIFEIFVTYQSMQA